MQLPDAYLQKFSAVPEYFQAIHNAQPPERFTYKFLENLGFTSTNDRLFIGVLKSLGFLDADGTPTAVYFDFLDGTKSRRTVATAIKTAYAGLFAVNKSADKMSAEEVKNKLRTLYAGAKSDTVIERIAKTFVELCEYADFTGEECSATEKVSNDDPARAIDTPHVQSRVDGNQSDSSTHYDDRAEHHRPRKPAKMESLQYHINIVLPESRDQAVYDAIFRSLRDHLG